MAHRGHSADPMSISTKTTTDFVLRTRRPQSASRYIVAFHRDGGKDAPRYSETHIDGRTAECKIYAIPRSANPSVAYMDRHWVSCEDAARQLN